MVFVEVFNDKKKTNLFSLVFSFWQLKRNFRRVCKKWNSLIEEDYFFSKLDVSKDEMKSDVENECMLKQFNK